MSKLQLKNPATLYIVRHGQTDWNVKRRIQGHTDIPLNEEGEKQAHKARSLFKNIHFDKVFSSDLLRAKKTAEIITLERTLAIQTTAILRERNFGPLEGKYIDEIAQMEKDLTTLSDAEQFIHRLDPGMENDEELMGRFITFLREISVTYAGKTVLVVCHGALMRIFLIHLGEASYASLQHGTIENTAYIQLESDGIDFVVKKTHGIHGK